MKNPEAKTKLRAVLKAAIIGGAIFAAITAVSIIGDANKGGYLFYSLQFWFSVPSDFLWHLFKEKEPANPFDSSFLYGSYRVVVNGLIGALVCAFFSASWQCLKKGHYDK